MCTRMLPEQHGRNHPPGLRLLSVLLPSTSYTCCEHRHTCVGEVTENEMALPSHCKLRGASLFSKHETPTCETAGLAFVKHCELP